MNAPVKLTLEQWLLACASFLKTELHLTGLLDESDPYALHDAMVGAYELGKSPAEFIKVMFASELARVEQETLRPLGGEP